MAKKAAKFDANSACQPLYHEISKVIEHLSFDDAIEVLEHLSGHCDGMIEGIQADKEEAEPE